MVAHAQPRQQSPEAVQEGSRCGSCGGLFDAQQALQAISLAQAAQVGAVYCRGGVQILVGPGVWGRVAGRGMRRRGEKLTMFPGPTTTPEIPTRRWVGVAGCLASKQDPAHRLCQGVGDGLGIVHSKLRARERVEGWRGGRGGMEARGAGGGGGGGEEQVRCMQHVGDHLTLQRGNVARVNVMAAGTTSCAMSRT